MLFLGMLVFVGFEKSWLCILFELMVDYVLDVTVTELHQPESLDLDDMPTRLLQRILSGIALTQSMPLSALPCVLT
jgi:hypothetical protein